MIKIQRTKLNNYRKGFTLIELMITIFIISIGLIGIMTLIQNTLGSASFVKLNLKAAYLAQEGIELTRNVRDNNWLNQDDYKNGLSNCSAGCQIDYKSNNLSIYNDNFLLIDNNNFYNHSSGDESKFKRKITINDKNEYLEIISEVFWSHRGDDYSIEVVEYLYDWL